MQTHIDPEDIVLREHVSQTIFIIFPKIVTVLIKITQEETIKGPSLVAVSIVLHYCLTIHLLIK